MIVRNDYDKLVTSALGRLAQHRDDVVRRYAKEGIILYGTYRYARLYEAACTLNPYKRSKTSQFRQRCAQSARDGVQRCIVAECFYWLAAGRYHNDDILKHVVLNKMFDLSFDN